MTNVIDRLCHSGPRTLNNDGKFTINTKLQVMSLVREVKRKRIEN